MDFIINLCSSMSVNKYTCKDLFRKNKQTKYKFGEWNVRTLTSNESCVERRSTIISITLKTHDIDFDVLNGTKLPGEYQLTKSGTGYMFFWSGCLGAK